MSILAVGQQAPDFSLQTDQVGMFTLSAQLGKPVVLFFYPKDDTSGCTIENIEFSGLKSKFDALDAVLVGLSPDSTADHAAFRQKYDLSVILAADPEQDAIVKYGAWGPKYRDGKTTDGLVRTTFLIDKNGLVSQIWIVGHTQTHAEQVLLATQSLPV